MKRQIEEGLRLGSLHPLAADLAEVYEAATARRREIEDGGNFSPDYKRSLIDALETETAAVVERAKAEYRKTSTRPLDAEEGALLAAQRDAANDPGAAFREARASRFGTLMANARGADDVDRIWADVRLTADGDAIGAAATAGFKRLSDLAAARKGVPAQHAELTARFQAFEAAVDEWQRANPSPARRLTQIERQRFNVGVAIEETAEFCARVYGMGSPSRVASNFHEGRVFDRRNPKTEAIDAPASERMLTGANRTGVRR